MTVPHVNKPVEPKHFCHYDGTTVCEVLEPHFEIEKVVPFERSGLARRVLDGLLSNRLFVLNNRRALNLAYRYYMRRLFSCRDESECQRIYIRARAK